MICKHHLVLLLIVTLLALCGYGSSTPAPAQSPPGSTKLLSIKGRVLSDGQAVPNATVTVSNINTNRHVRTVPTNDNGDFEVKNLEPGMYRVEVSAPAYVSVPVEPDEEIHRTGESITLNMIKGGVITGKVTTADNDPLVAVRVRAMMVRDESGRRPSQPVQSFHRFTDDRGIYRIFGLLPGTYVVFAGGRGLLGWGDNAYDNDAPTFAPSSTRDTAEEVSLGQGEERTIDIRYRSAVGHSVSGQVSAGNAADSRRITVKLERIMNSEPDLRVLTYARDTKAFEFQGVAAGDYVVWAEHAAQSGELLRSDPKPITVKGTDVTGIELNLKPLALVAGAVVLELSNIEECTGKARPLLEETTISIQRHQVSPSTEDNAKNQPFEPSSQRLRQTSPDAAGVFQVHNLAAGQYNLGIRFFPRHWYLRSLTLPGAKDATIDLARNHLNLKSGDRISGIKATLSEGAASISGHVELPEEKRSARIVLYLTPVKSDATDDVLRHFATPVADDGSFSVDQVPPGRYWTLAKIDNTDKGVSTPSLRAPAMAEARVKLRRQAEDAKHEIELKPCRNVRNYTLPLTNN